MQSRKTANAYSANMPFSIASRFASYLQAWSRRNVHISGVQYGLDATKKRLNHPKKSDKVDGQDDSLSPDPENESYELVTPDLMDRVFYGIKFRDIPVLYLRCTRNNTKITVTTSNLGRIALKTAGGEGYKNCRKGTTVAAQAVATRVLSILKDYDLDTVRVVFDGLGPGRNSAFKTLESSSLKIVSLSDRTTAQEPWIARPRRPKSV